MLLGAAFFTDQRRPYDPPHRGRGEPSESRTANFVALCRFDPSRCQRVAGNPLVFQVAKRLHVRSTNSTTGTGGSLDLWPVLGVEQHPVDLQFVQIIFPAAIVAEEGDDVLPSIGSSSAIAKWPGLARLETRRPARKIASRDFERAALADGNASDNRCPVGSRLSSWPTAMMGCELRTLLQQRLP